MSEFQAGRETATFSPDSLIAGDAPLKHEKVTLDTVAADMVRGTALGKITLGALVATPDGGNTGDGVMTGLVSAANTVAGDYVLKCIDATAKIFSVTAPDGNRLDDAVVAVAYANDHLGFTLPEGGTPFAADDLITVNVAAGSGKYITSLAAAVDGSQNIAAILADDVTAPDPAADVEAMAYTAGHFLGEELTLGTGHTVSSIKDALHDKGIYLT